MTYPIYDQFDFTPINSLQSVTPSDTTDLTYLGRTASAKALIITAVGSVCLDYNDGTTVTLPVAANALTLPIWVRVRRVRATGTTVAAGNIFAAF